MGAERSPRTGVRRGAPADTKQLRATEDIPGDRPDEMPTTDEIRGDSADLPHTVIYYDLARVSADLVRRVRAAANGPTREAACADLEWPAELHGQTPIRFGGHRDLEVVNRAWRWTDDLVRALGNIGLKRRGVDLADVARYAFLFRIAPWLHRLDVQAIVCGSWCPVRVLWVHDADARDAARLRDLLEGIGVAGTRVTLVDGGRRLSWYRTARSWAGRRVLPGLVVVARLRGPGRAKRWGGAESGVVFTEYFPNSMYASLPVARLLEARHGVRPMWVAGRREVAEALRAEGVAPLDLDAIAAGWRPMRRLAADERARVLAVLDDVVCDAASAATFGAGVDPVALRRLIADALLPLLESAAAWVDRYAAVLERLRPRPRLLVSTTYSSIPGRAAASVAAGLGADTVYIQHGLLPDEPYISSYCHRYKLMWGDYERRSLVRNGHDPESVFVVGPTIYDDLVRRAAANPPYHFPRPDEPLRLLLFASRTGGAVVSRAVAERTLRATAEAVRDLDGVSLTVKVHPADGTAVPERVLANYPGVRVLRGGRSGELVLKADVVLISSSTTGFEACLADRPLVVLNLTGVKEVTAFTRYGAALEATSPEELTACIERLRTEPDLREDLARGRARVIEERLGGATGDAAERAASFLARLPIPHDD